MLWVACCAIAARFVVDLIPFHYAATMALKDPLRIYSYPDNGTLLRFFYGPLTAVLMAPLGLFPLSVAKWIWIGLQTGAYVLFWFFLLRLYPLVARWPLFLILFLFSINPIHTNFQTNNISLMLATTLLLCEIWRRSRKPTLEFLSGVGVSLCAAVKIFPAFILLFYWIVGRKRLRLGLLLGLLVSFLIPLVYFGPSITWSLFEDFLGNLKTYEAENNFRVEDILCMPSFVLRWFTPVLGEHSARMLVNVIFVTLSSLFFGTVWFLRRRTPSESESWNSFWALALALMALLNSSTRVHYLIFYVPALCLLLENLFIQFRIWKLLAVGLIFATVALTAQSVVGKTTNDLLESWSLPTVGLMFLVGTVVYLISKALLKQSSGIPA